MATIALQNGEVVLKDGNVSCSCCGCNVKAVIAEYNKFGHMAFDGSNRYFLERTFIDDGGDDCGVGTSFCRLNNCNEEILISCSPGPSGGCVCALTICPGGIEIITSPTRLDVQCPPSGCGDDHVELSLEFTTSLLEEKISELISYSFNSVNYGECANSFFSGENCDEVSATIEECECSLISYFYTDNDELNDSTYYIQKRKIMFKAQYTTYCKKTFNANGGLISQEDFNCTIGSEYTINSPSEIGYIELTPQGC